MSRNRLTLRYIIWGTIVALILSSALFSCDSPSEVKKPNCEIVEVRRGGTTTNLVYIKIYCPRAGSHITYDEWFEGSDTCKVGQIVRLR